jgi:hypothetical protein
MTGLSVVSQTLCNIEVLPAFALPMMRTLNLTFGARGLVSRAGDGARDGAKDGDGDGTGAGDGAGAGDGTGAGDGAGPKQQINCFTPIARKCCETGLCVGHTLESGASSCYYTQYKHQLTSAYSSVRAGACRFI